MKIILSISLICVLTVSLFIPSEVSADSIDDILPYLIKQESRGDPNAVGTSGEIGLCQISPIVLKEWNQVSVSEHKKAEKEYYEWQQKRLDSGEATFYIAYMSFADTRDLVELWDKRKNIEIATWYLRRLRDHYLGRGMHVFAAHPEKRKVCIGTFLKDSRDISIKNFPNISGMEDYELALILAAYNGGITRLRKNNYDINKMPKSTRKYVKDIMAMYKNALIKP